MTSGKITFLPAMSLKDTTVHNARGEKLGEVIELMVDMESGLIIYAILAAKDISNQMGKLFAVPWPALHVLKSDNKAIVLNITRERLKKAPGFSKSSWPASASWAWLNEVYQYYGYAYPF